MKCVYIYCLTQVFLVYFTLKIKIEKESEIKIKLWRHLNKQPLFFFFLLSVYTEVKQPPMVVFLFAHCAKQSRKKRRTEMKKSWGGDIDCVVCASAVAISLSSRPPKNVLPSLQRRRRVSLFFFYWIEFRQKWLVLLPDNRRTEFF